MRYPKLSLAQLFNIQDILPSLSRYLWFDSNIGGSRFGFFLFSFPKKIWTIFMKTLVNKHVIFFLSVFATGRQTVGIMSSGKRMCKN